MDEKPEPDRLRDLADRIDHEELWRRSALDDTLTPEQRDRRDAGVNLRRYASQRGAVLQELKKGREYMRGFKLERYHGGTDARGCGDIEWHRAINAFGEGKTGAKEWPRVMYTAKLVADEVPRMILLFERERTTGLASSYKMCGHDPRPATELVDNHLRCELGAECRKCPYLAAIDANDRMSPEAKDEAKAWTCATHILLESKPDAFFEQFLRDKSDDAFDARLAESFGN